MSALPGTTCPDDRLLERFLAGHLTDAEAGPLEQHCEDCAGCVERLDRARPRDELLDAIHKYAQGGGPQGTPEAVSLLIERLRRLATPEPPQAPPTVGPASEDGGRWDTPGGGSPESHPPRLGRYQLLRPLGAGGMGTVYLAEDLQLGRRVAVKVPHFAGTVPVQSPDHRRFLREARAAAAVRHPRVCSIHDVGEEGGIPFVVMDYIEGCSLAERQHRDGRFEDCRAAVALAAQIAEGLAAVHDAGIIHRDLKPANVLLDHRGDAYLSDFGLARRQDDPEHLTANGAVVGTPAYMAPEQVNPSQFGPVTPHTDVYSLGGVLYQMLTGHLPFQDGDTLRLLHRIVHDRPTLPRQLRPDLDPALEAIVLRAMARRPEDRFADARQLTVALRGWLSGAAARGAAVVVPRRRWPLRTAGVLLGLLLLGGALWLGRHLLHSANSGGTDKAGGRRGAPVTEPLAGWIDVRVWKKENLRGRGRWLGPDVLPLKPDDEIRVEAKLNRPAYLYVVWLDTAGKPLPIYPWGPRWDRRAEEIAIDHLSLPTTGGNRWPITRGEAGMETLLLLARETPWPPDVDLRALLADLPQPALQDPSSVVWFRNWAVVRDEDNRAPNLFDERPGDPVLLTQEKLRKRLQRHCVFSRAVSFANAGR